MQCLVTLHRTSISNLLRLPVYTGDEPRQIDCVRHDGGAAEGGLRRTSALPRDLRGIASAGAGGTVLCLCACVCGIF